MTLGIGSRHWAGRKTDHTRTKHNMIKQTWTTDDGKTFDTEEQAQAWEQQRQAARQKLVRFLKTKIPTGASIEHCLLDAAMEELVDFLEEEAPEALAVLLSLV